MTPSDSAGKFTDILGFIGGALCVVAGLYLFSAQTQDPDSFIQTIAHGMGIYFVGKGLYIFQAVIRRSAQTWYLARMRDDKPLPNTPPTPVVQEG